MIFKFTNKEQIERQRKERKERKEQEKIINQTVCFTGHRPNKLDNAYNFKHPTALKLRDKLLEIIETLIVQENVNRFISGGAIGTDQIAFWSVEIKKIEYPHIKNIVAIPFKNQDKIWKSESRKWYKKMLKKADEVINVEEIYIDNNVLYGDYSSKKMKNRNIYMCNESKFVVAVYDGSKGGTGSCLKYAQSIGLNIWRINPKHDFESYGFK